MTLEISYRAGCSVVVATWAKIYLFGASCREVDHIVAVVVLM